MFKNKTVVITGGCGFIGTNLARSLVLQGANVVIVSRHGSSTDVSNVRYLHCNLQVTSLFHILEYAHIKPDYIFHLAAMSGGIHYLMQRQAECLQTNLSITANSLYKINEIPSLRGQLFLSSVCAYPQDYQTTTDAHNIILSEELSDKYNPDSSYGWSKIMGEMLIKHYADEHSVPGVSIRLFNTYGPYEHFNAHRAHVLPALIMKALKYPDTDFNVLGNGAQVRAFLYIEDAIKALEKAVVHVYNGDIINVGSSKACTIKELVDKVVHISGKDIVPIYEPTAAVGAKGRVPDLTKVNKILQWAPTTSLDEGLMKTYAWALKEFNRGKL